MTLSSLLSPLTRRTRWRGIQGICYNEKGISAVEFALIAPLMVLIEPG
jgi:Flp pilus assembly protein TadG